MRSSEWGGGEQGGGEVCGGKGGGPLGRGHMGEGENREEGGEVKVLRGGEEMAIEVK